MGSPPFCLQDISYKPFLEHGSADGLSHFPLPTRSSQPDHVAQFFSIGQITTGYHGRCAEGYSLRPGPQQSVPVHIKMDGQLVSQKTFSLTSLSGIKLGLKAVALCRNQSDNPC